MKFDVICKYRPLPNYVCYVLLLPHGFWSLPPLSRPHSTLMFPLFFIPSLALSRMCSLHHLSLSWSCARALLHNLAPSRCLACSLPPSLAVLFFYLTHTLLSLRSLFVFSSYFSLLSVYCPPSCVKWKSKDPVECILHKERWVECQWCLFLYATGLKCTLVVSFLQPWVVFIMQNILQMKNDHFLLD